MRAQNKIDDCEWFYSPFFFTHQNDLDDMKWYFDYDDWTF